MFRTRLTELLGITHPIIQGGLAHLAFAGLAAAVSNAGGLGQITANALENGAALREEIAQARRLTTQPFGVNFALGRRPIDDLLEVALVEGVSVISFTGGNPELYLRRAAGTGVKKMVLVAATRQAKKAEELGADVIVAVGQEGGGHIGRDDVGTFVLVPRVLDAVRVPVVASGGIADGRGLLAALALGAQGVEMGTRFVATQECMAHARYKEALVGARETDTVVIERSIGRPGRVLDGPWPRQILAAEAAGTDAASLLPLIGGDRNRRAARAGELEEGYAWAGQAVGLIDDIPTVAELIARMVRQAEEGCRRLRALSTLGPLSPDT